MNLILDHIKQTNEEREEAALKRTANTAVEIAAQVNKYVTREVLRPVNCGSCNPYLLEEMVLAYAVAMSNFALYKTLDHGKTWDDFKQKAIDSLEIAFDHCKTTMEEEKKKCN